MKCNRCDKEFRYDEGRNFIERQYIRTNEKSYSMKTVQIDKFNLCNNCTREFYKILDTFFKEGLND